MSDVIEGMARAMAAYYDENLIEIPSPGYWDMHEQDWLALARVALDYLKQPQSEICPE